MSAILIDRLMAKSIPEPNSGCWLWIGALGRGGYGNFHMGGRYVNAHRAAYELLVGPVPAGLDLDHKCRVRCCINPQHLEPVSRAVNLARGQGVTRLKARVAAQTHCKHGHPLAGNNLIITKAGNRSCRECARRMSREYVRAKRRIDPSQYRV